MALGKSKNVYSQWMFYCEYRYKINKGTLANQLGVARQTLVGWEKGFGKPSMKHVIKMVELSENQFTVEDFLPVKKNLPDIF